MPLLHAVRRWFNRDRPLDIDSTHLIAEPVTEAPVVDPRQVRTGFRDASITEEGHRPAGDPGVPIVQHPPGGGGDEVVESPEPAGESSEIESADDPRSTMRRIEEALRSGRDSQAVIAEAVGEVRPAKIAIERLAERQQRLIDVVEHQSAESGRRDERAIDAIERMSENLDRSNEVTGLVQRQLDANHEVVRQTVVRLDQVAAAIDEGRRASESIGVAMNAMVEEMNRRDEAHEIRNGVLQGWIIASVIACIAATGAALALAWAVMGMQP